MLKIIVERNGTKKYSYNSLLHREDGPAVERVDGHKEWWFEGVRHRTGGPAIMHPTGFTEWFLNGKLHREDGPAIESPYGDHKYYLNNIFYKTKECWFDNLSEESKIKLLFSNFLTKSFI